MTARELTLALGGRWRGNAGKAHCPCHDDRTPSMSIRDGDVGVLVHCFAGCRSDDIITELRRQGVWQKPEPGKRRRRVAPRPVVHKPDPAAIEMWKSARPDDGTIVGRYLRGRGIDLAVPSVIRVTPTNDLIAAVQAPNGEIIAVQVTKLVDGKKAEVAIPRITTGALGHGAVRLDKATDIVGIAEGTETALSAMQIFNIPVWASLGAARMHRVVIPDSVRELHVFGDNGAPGRAAVEQMADTHRARKRVLHFPPEAYKDFNDLLKAKRGRAA